MLPAYTSLLAGRAPAMLRCGRRVATTLPTRSFTNAALRVSSSPLKSVQNGQKRLGTISIVRNYSSSVDQSAPNPKAYIDSGVIKPQQTVDVKKVVVIGSGGLAIGQAGEFDYSGWSSPELPAHPTWQSTC